MKVLIADPFETSGLDGLAAAGLRRRLRSCPQGRRRWPRRCARPAPRCSSCGPRRSRRRCWTPATSALIVRAGAGYNTIDVAAASARGIYVSNCPGKNCDRGRGAGIRTHPRARPADPGQRRGTAGRAAGTRRSSRRPGGSRARTLGLLGFGNIAQEVARRAQAFGMDIVIWSRRFEAGAGPDVDLRRLRPGSGEPGLPGHASVPTPRDVAAVADVLSVHRRTRPRDPRARRRGAPRRGSGRAPSSSTRSRAEVVDHDALAAAVRDRGMRVGSGRLSRMSRRPARASTRCRCWPCPASTGRTTSARRPSRPRRRSPPRRSGSSARSRRPAGFRTASTSLVGRRRRTCSSSATTTGRACWPTCSSTCARTASTSWRPRTSSSRTPRRPSPGSTWMAHRTTRASPRSQPATTTS